MPSDALLAIPMLVGMVWSFSAIALGKHLGDALSAWVIAHDSDDAPTPDYGLERKRNNHISLDAYRYYARRYRQLRKQRGEDVRLALWFELTRSSRWAVMALVFAFYAVVAILRS